MRRPQGVAVRSLMDQLYEVEVFPSPAPHSWKRACARAAVKGAPLGHHTVTRSALDSGSMRGWMLRMGAGAESGVQEPAIAGGMVAPRGSTGTVDVSAVVDMDHKDEQALVEDLVDNPIGPSAGAPHALEFALQRLPDTAWGAHEVTVNELDDRGNDTRRDAVQVAPSCASELDLIGVVVVAQRAVRRGTLNSARICFSLEVVPSARSCRAWATSSRIPGRESQNRVSCRASHSSAPIRTAAGDPFLVIVTCSWVSDTASTNSLSLSFTLEIGSVCMSSL
jgi:hypothetical protein